MGQRTLEILKSSYHHHHNFFKLPNQNEMSTVSNPSQHSAVDYISFLPDEILFLILSHIPTKFAIRTSVLSKRWRLVWHETPSISIDSCGVNPTSINKTLISSYTAPKITSFDLRVNSSVTISLVVSWIKLAMSRNAENLSLTFSDPDYRIPYCMVIRITFIRRFHYDQISNVFPKHTLSWTSLKKLSLTCWNLSSESIAKILSGLSMLESLTLNTCNGLYCLDLSECMNLTRLEIINNYFWPGPAKIVAPHIHFLRFIGFHKSCTLVDVSSLTAANLNTDSFLLLRNNDCIQDIVVKMLEMLQNIEKLTIGAIFLQILSLAEVRGVPFPQLKIKILVIETIIVRSIIPGITRLLQNSHELKKIIVYTIKCEAITDRKLDKYFNTKGLKADQGWNEFFPTVEQTSSIHDGIAKDAKSEHVALFMELLLRSAMKLEMIVLRLDGYLNVTEYQKLLLMFPTVSSRNNETNIRKYGRDKANLISFKITP